MIRINTLGRIASGYDQGKFVKIQELPDNPHSYLVLTAADRNFKTFGGDAWVEDGNCLGVSAGCGQHPWPSDEEVA